MHTPHLPEHNQVPPLSALLPICGLQPRGDEIFARELRRGLLGELREAVHSPSQRQRSSSSRDRCLGRTRARTIETRVFCLSAGGGGRVRRRRCCCCCCCGWCCHRGRCRGGAVPAVDNVRRRVRDALSCGDAVRRYRALSHDLGGAGVTEALASDGGGGGVIHRVERRWKVKQVYVLT